MSFFCKHKVLHRGNIKYSSWKHKVLRLVNMEYNIILFFNKIILHLQERKCHFFVNTKFFVSVNKRRCIILFFLLRRIILYLQERSVIFYVNIKFFVLQIKSSSSLLIRAMYNIILLINKIILYLQERSVIFCVVNTKFFIFVNIRR